MGIKSKDRLGKFLADNPRIEKILLVLRMQSNMPIRYKLTYSKARSSLELFIYEDSFNMSGFPYTYNEDLFHLYINQINGQIIVYCYENQKRIESTLKDLGIHDNIKYVKDKFYDEPKLVPKFLEFPLYNKITTLKNKYESKKTLDENITIFMEVIIKAVFVLIPVGFLILYFSQRIGNR